MFFGVEKLENSRYIISIFLTKTCAGSWANRTAKRYNLKERRNLDPLLMRLVHAKLVMKAFSNVQCKMAFSYGSFERIWAMSFGKQITLKNLKWLP